MECKISHGRYRLTIAEFFPVFSGVIAESAAAHCINWRDGKSFFVGKYLHIRPAMLNAKHSFFLADKGFVGAVLYMWLPNNSIKLFIGLWYSLCYLILIIAQRYMKSKAFSLHWQQALFPWRHNLLRQRKNPLWAGVGCWFQKQNHIDKNRQKKTAV